MTIRPVIVTGLEHHRLVEVVPLHVILVEVLSRPRVQPTLDEAANMSCNERNFQTSTHYPLPQISQPQPHPLPLSSHRGSTSTCINSSSPLNQQENQLHAHLTHKTGNAPTHLFSATDQGPPTNPGKSIFDDSDAEFPEGEDMGAPISDPEPSLPPSLRAGGDMRFDGQA